MSHFAQDNNSFYLKKRDQISQNRDRRSVSSSPENQHPNHARPGPNKIRWVDHPQTKFFEKFARADRLLDEDQLRRRSPLILKRIKATESHRERLRLEGFRGRKKPRMIESKNLKLQSTGLPRRDYNCFCFTLLKAWDRRIGKCV